jgi:hypothetical protein
MDPDPPALRCGETRQCEVVQVDETGQQLARWVDLDGQAPFGEIDLHFRSPLIEAAPHFMYVLADEILDEARSRIVRQAPGRVQQARARSGDAANGFSGDRHSSQPKIGRDVPPQRPPL